jgi:DNA-binding MarR family transcriptional regulator
MNDSIKPDDIDPVIHERVRLGIVSALAVAPELSFNELKSTLGLSDGNLSAHAKNLQQAGYIEIAKSFKGRRPHTAMRLTPAGLEAFRGYVDTLRKIIQKGDEARDGSG